MPTATTWTVVAEYDGVPAEHRADVPVVADTRFAFVTMTAPSATRTVITALVEAGSREAAENIGRLSFAQWARMFGLPDEPATVTAA